MCVSQNASVQFDYWHLAHSWRGTDSVDSPAIQQHEWCPIYEEPMPERIEYDWYRMLLRCLENGIVLRKIKTRKSNKLVWASGIMIQSGSKWVWHERTVPQICSAGVQVPPVCFRITKYHGK